MENNMKNMNKSSYASISKTFPRLLHRSRQDRPRLQPLLGALGRRGYAEHGVHAARSQQGAGHGGDEAGPGALSRALLGEDLQGNHAVLRGWDGWVGWVGVGKVDMFSLVLLGVKVWKMRWGKKLTDICDDDLP